MSEQLSPAPAAAVSGRPFTRRSLLAAALAGTALTVVACTDGDRDPADAVTPAQVDQLAAQVRVQETVVAAYAQALAADPALAADAGVPADQARAQLDRLRAAAPGGTPSAAGTSPPAPAPDPAGARAWLRDRVTAAADAHAAACPDFAGGRAALLGSVAAGLRGQAEQLA